MFLSMTVLPSANVDLIVNGPGPSPLFFTKKLSKSKDIRKCQHIAAASLTRSSFERNSIDFKSGQDSSIISNLRVNPTKS